MSKMLNGMTPINVMDAIRDETGDLWVVNTNRSTVNNHVDRCRIALHINDHNRIMIEASFIPQNLSEIGDKDVIAKSNEFKRAVNAGLISIVTPESARRYMERNDARTEYARIQGIRNAVVNQSVTTHSSTPNERADRRGELTNPMASQNDVIVSEVNPVVLNIMAHAETTTSDALHASIKNCGDDRLSAKDYEHVRDVAKEHGMDKLARWAEKAVQRKLAEAPQDDEYAG